MSLLLYPYSSNGMYLIYLYGSHTHHCWHKYADLRFLLIYYIFAFDCVLYQFASLYHHYELRKNLKLQNTTKCVGSWDSTPASKLGVP